MINYEEFKIGAIVAYDSLGGLREGVVVGYSVNDVNEDVLLVCWTDTYKVAKCHSNNVYTKKDLIYKKWVGKDIWNM